MNIDLLTTYLFIVCATGVYTVKTMSNNFNLILFVIYVSFFEFYFIGFALFGDDKANYEKNLCFFL